MKSSKSVSLAEAQLDGAVNKPLLLSRSAMTELESKHNDGASTIMDEEVVGKEELQMIKARTMFQMTEELHGVGDSGRKRLLFLTNSQAELIASSEASMQKMLDALEIPRPKLVINLIASAGHSAQGQGGQAPGQTRGASAARPRREGEMCRRYGQSLLTSLRGLWDV